MARMAADLPALRMTTELDRVMRRAAELERNGTAVAHLERGEPDFDTPAHIVEALARAARDGLTHYPDPRGSPDLRAALAGKVTRENGIPCSAAEVVVSAGGTHGLYMALHALLGDGHELLALSPYWMALPKMVALTRTARYRGLPVYLDVQSGALDPEGLHRRVRDALRPETRGIYLNTPNNPTGVVMSRPHLEALARLCRERDLWVVSDEAYEHLVFGGARHLSIGSLPGMAERTVSVFTFSKSYAMTGWRLGYVVAPPATAAALGPLLSFHTTHGVFPAVQRAGLAALTGPQDCVREMCEAYRERADRLIAGLAQADGITLPRPDGAFYVFARLEGVSDPAALWRRVEEWLELGVAVLPGTAFGDDYVDRVRLSVATGPRELGLAAERLARRYAVRA